MLKLYKFEVSGHFQESIGVEWPEIRQAHVFWPPSELIRFWTRSVYFTHFGPTDLLKFVNFPRYFLEEA